MWIMIRITGFNVSGCVRFYIFVTAVGRVINCWNISGSLTGSWMRSCLSRTPAHRVKGYFVFVEGLRSIECPLYIVHQYRYKQR